MVTIIKDLFKVFMYRLSVMFPLPLLTVPRWILLLNLFWYILFKKIWFQYWKLLLIKSLQIYIFVHLSLRIKRTQNTIFRSINSDFIKYIILTMPAGNSAKPFWMKAVNKFIGMYNLQLFLPHRGWGRNCNVEIQVHYLYCAAQTASLDL